MGHQTVLRLDARELAFGPLGFIAGSLYRQLPLVALSLPAFFRVMERGQGRSDARRRERRKKRVHDVLLQPQSAKTLAFPFGSLPAPRLEAGVSGDGSTGTRVRDLHFASASTASQQTLAAGRLPLEPLHQHPRVALANWRVAAA